MSGPRDLIRSHKTMLELQLKFLDEKYQGKKKGKLFSKKARFQRLQILINFYNNYPEKAVKYKEFIEKICRQYNLPFTAAIIRGNSWNYKIFKKAIKKLGDDANIINQFYKEIAQTIESLNLSQKIAELDLNDEDNSLNILYELLERWGEDPKTVKDKLDQIKTKQELFTAFYGDEDSRLFATSPLDQRAAFDPPGQIRSTTSKYTTVSAALPILFEILNDEAYWKSKVYYSRKAGPDGILEMRNCLKKFPPTENNNRNAKILSQLQPIAEKSAKRTYSFFKDRRDPMTANFYAIFSNTNWDKFLEPGGAIEKLIEDHANFTAKELQKKSKKTP